jgi:hypothetical protein
MAAVIEAIGLISGALGIIGFLQDNIPGKPEAQGAKVRVKVGLQRTEDDPNVVSTVSVPMVILLRRSTNFDEER